jgi:hypothetical protein
MRFFHEEKRPRSNRVRRNRNRIGVKGKGSRPGFRVEIMKGCAETLVLIPHRVGRQVLPVPRPMADQLSIPCGGHRGKVSDPGIDPADRVDGIRAVGGDPVADEKILRDILLHPLPELLLLLDSPSPISYLPELIRGFDHRLAKRRSLKKDHQKNDEGKHAFILKRRISNCQQTGAESFDLRVEAGRFNSREEKTQPEEV